MTQTNYPNGYPVIVRDHDGTHTGRIVEGSHYHEGVRHLLIDRDDGVPGGGPHREWCALPEAVEPLRLTNGQQVCATNAEGERFYSAITGRGMHGTYTLDGSAEAWHRHQLQPVPQMPSQGTPVDTASPPSYSMGSPAETDPPEGYAYDSAQTLHALNDGARLASPLPNDSPSRKLLPVHDVMFGCFPAACVAVTAQAMKGQAQHNDGTAHVVHDRSKSADHENCIIRHMMEGDWEAVAWRALAKLQEVKEAEGAPVAPRAINVVQ